MQAGVISDEADAQPPNAAPSRRYYLAFAFWLFPKATGSVAQPKGESKSIVGLVQARICTGHSR
jgi:hypothetical protein